MEDFVFLPLPIDLKLILVTENKCRRDSWQNNWAQLSNKVKIRDVWS